MDEWKLAVFDLDGVLTDTANYHFLAWKQTMEMRGIPVDDEVNDLVKGISRADSLSLILKRAHIPLQHEVFEELLIKKNETYQTMIKQLTQKDVLPGILDFLEELRKQGICCVVASASKSAEMILQQLGIRSYFKGVVDPASINKGKPAPDIFIRACEMVQIPIKNAIGFEDARAGIQAIRQAGMKAVGIGQAYLKEEHPDCYYPSTACLHMEDIIHTIREGQ